MDAYERTNKADFKHVFPDFQQVNILVFNSSKLFFPFNLASSKYIINIQTSCDKKFHGLTLGWMKKYLLVFWSCH